MRGRRRPRVVWLPLLGNSVQQNPTDLAWGVRGGLDIADDGGIYWDAFPITFDYQDSAYRAQTDADFQATTLHDIVQGNAYRLRRIVGDAFLGNFPRDVTSQEQRQTPIECAAGFIVCRTDADGDPTTSFDEVNPLVQESAEDPWIWTKRWILGIPPILQERFGPTVIEGGNSFVDSPSTTTQFGSVADGPTVDQKTARVISADERLFCVIAGRRFNTFTELGFPGSGNVLQYEVAVRMVGSLRTNQGNRRNTSR